MTTLPVMKTNRLTLREVALEDAAEMANWQSAPESWRLQAVEPSEYTDGERIKRYMQHRGEGENRRIYAFAAVENTSGRVIGEIGATKTYPATVAVGFGVAHHSWGNGYATEMLGEILEFVFAQLGAHRVTADVAIENTACCQVLTKAGMQLEGTAREFIHAQGRWWNEHQFAILARDPRP